MKASLVISLVVVIFSTTPQKDEYYSYRSSSGGFEFQCPSNWVFQPDTISNDTGGYVGIDSLQGRFVPIDSLGIAAYNDCYDGVVFYVEIINLPLENALLDNDMYYKLNDIFYTNYGFMSSDSLKTENITGKDWKGIHHINTCRIHCKREDIRRIVEGCEVLYFKWQTHGQFFYLRACI